MKMIPLTRGLFAKIDDEDFNEISKYKWFAQFNYCAGKYYAIRNIRGTNPRKKIKMHRQIMNAKKEQMIDHKNSDTLDNQKDNLRICDKYQNVWNRRKIKNASSKFKGVYWYAPTKKWGARIGYKYKNIFIGYFKKEIEAANAVDNYAEKLHGDFACFNLPSRGK